MPWGLGVVYGVWSKGCGLKCCSVFFSGRNPANVVQLQATTAPVPTQQPDTPGTTTTTTTPSQPQTSTTSSADETTSATIITTPCIVNVPVGTSNETTSAMPCIVDVEPSPGLSIGGVLAIVFVFIIAVVVVVVIIIFVLIFMQRRKKASHSVTCKFAVLYLYGTYIIIR